MFYYFEFEILVFCCFFSDPISIQELYVIYNPWYIKVKRLDDEINESYRRKRFSEIPQFPIAWSEIAVVLF